MDEVSSIVPPAEAMGLAQAMAATLCGLRLQAGAMERPAGPPLR